MLTSLNAPYKGPKVSVYESTKGLNCLVNSPTDLKRGSASK